MTIEQSISALTLSTTNLITAVGSQRITVDDAIAAFNVIITKVNSGLNNVNNTSDLNKPISIATLAAINEKQTLLISGSNISTVNGQSLLSGLPLVIERSATSLNKVSYDDRGQLRLLTPQLDDSSVVENIGLFVWINTKLEPDDDETCFTTATGQWLLRCPSWDLLDAWSLHEQSIIDDWMEDESKRFATYLLNK